MGQAIQLRLTLSDIEPTIWRSVLVSDAVTLVVLHHTIQAAFGWQDCHLHQFEVDGICYETPHPDLSWDSPPLRDERRVRLSRFVGAGIRSFDYIYDFGDDWAHRIEVEDTCEADPQGLPLLVGGERACPPEDCGGFPGYEELLETMSNPIADSEDRERREWLLHMVGPEWDPDHFDTAAAAVRLNCLRAHR